MGRKIHAARKILAEAKNLAATVALYALYSDQNIYVQLPQPFRDLWKGWTTGIQDDITKAVRERHAAKVALCAALEEAWLDDPRSKTKAHRSSSVPPRQGNPDASAPLEDEGWEAGDTGDGGSYGGSYWGRSRCSACS